MREDKFYIEKVKNGESEYFSFLVKKYQQHLFNIVNKTVKDYSVSEDIVQDAFFKVFKSIRNFKSGEPFFPYLLKIAVNCTNDYFDRENRKSILMKNLSQKSKIAGQVENIEKVRTLYELIYSLPENEREILLLFYRDGKSIKEISLLLGISANNVKVRLFRARKKLFEMWKKNK